MYSTVKSNNTKKLKMAILGKISLETRYQLNNAAKNFRIQDTTDYASEGIATTDVTGALVIKNPLGSIIHSTILPLFDIDVNVQDYIDSILLPLDVNGAVMLGNYSVEYSILVAGAVQPGTYTKTFIYNYTYKQVTPSINILVDLICSTLTGEDTTAYQPELTSSVITNTIFPPAGLDPVAFPEKITATVTNVYQGITTKTWTVKIVRVAVFTYSDGHIVDDTIIGDSEKDIVDDINICNLQCNMRALVSRYSQALQFNPIDAVRIYNEQIAPALINAFMYTSNIQCGNFAKAQEYYQEVLKFTDSSPECECDNADTPTLIIASCVGGAGGTFVVDACGANNAITVSASVLGDTTTYTICFNQVLFDKLNDLTETIITSADGSVTIVPATNGYTKTWDLSSNSGVNSFSGVLNVDFTDKAASPTFTWKSGFSTTIGPKLQEPNIVKVYPVFADWSKNPNCFYLEGYIAASGGEFPKPIMQIANILFAENLRSSQPNSICNQSRLGNVIISDIDQVNDRIYFKIVDIDGSPINGSTLTSSVDLILITVIINA